VGCGLRYASCCASAFNAANSFSMTSPSRVAVLAFAIVSLHAHGLHVGVGFGSSAKLSSDSGANSAAVQALSPAAGRGRTVLTAELLNGLGNQLFQVSALLALARDHGPSYAVALPNVSHVGNRSTYWQTVMRKLQPLLRSGGDLRPGSSIRNGQCTVDQVPSFNALDKDCGKATIFRHDWASVLSGRGSCKGVTLRGYFQDPRYFIRHLPFLRRVFSDQESVEKARRHLAELVPRKGPVVGLHYRLGDYEPNGWVLDRDYYDEAMREVVQRIGNQTTCLIFSDDPEQAWQRSETLEGCSKRVLVPKNETDVTSFYMMGLTDANVLADSTFSYFAALLGSGKRVVVAPRMAGPKASCWSYLRSGPPAQMGEPEWLTVQGTALSAGQLVADEILSLASPDDT